jgi:hypothetical protein
MAVPGFPASANGLIMGSKEVESKRPAELKMILRNRLLSSLLV